MTVGDVDGVGLFSPRARGWTVHYRRDGGSVLVFPASAGMDRRNCAALSSSRFVFPASAGMDRQ